MDIREYNLVMKSFKKFWVLALSASFILTTIVWAAPPAEAGTLATFCANGSTSCAKRKFLRLPAKKG